MIQKLLQKYLQALLKRRHLAPQFDSRIVPGSEDQMIIDEIPDILHSGHVHSNGITNYRGVTIINSGTWQSQTDFQSLCGHEPTPSKLPILNMKTREVSILDFSEIK